MTEAMAKVHLTRKWLYTCHQMHMTRDPESKMQLQSRLDTIDDDLQKWDESFRVRLKWVTHFENYEKEQSA